MNELFNIEANDYDVNKIGSFSRFNIGLKYMNSNAPLDICVLERKIENNKWKFRINKFSSLCVFHILR